MTATYTGTRDIPLGELTPYPGNARRGDVDAIAGSLEANGQYRSLIVRDTGDGQLVILAGNHTAEALQSIGRESARCEVITCDDATALRINLADNRTSDRAHDDPDDLAALLAALDGAYDGTAWTGDEASELFRLSGLLGDRAAGFLDDFAGGDPDPAPPAGSGQGDPAPPPRGGAHDDGHVQVHWLVTLYQRDVIQRALAAARDQLGLATSADALASICRNYLEDVNSDGE